VWYVVFYQSVTSLTVRHDSSAISQLLGIQQQHVDKFSKESS